MSALICLTHEAGQAVSAHALVVPMAGDGILDWATAKNLQVQTVLRAIAVTLGIIFVLIQAVASRGAMARIIISMVAAGLFVWGVFSITDVKDRFDNEINSQHHTTVLLGHPEHHTATSTASPTLPRS